MLVIVALASAPSMADDRVVVAVSPITYSFKGRQYMAVEAGPNVVVLLRVVGVQLAYGLAANLVPQGQWDYDATLGFLRQHVTPSSEIVGGAELAFELGFDANLIDDPRLG